MGCPLACNPSNEVRPMRSVLSSEHLSENSSSNYTKSVSVGRKLGAPTADVFAFSYILLTNPGGYRPLNGAQAKGTTHEW